MAPWPQLATVENMILDNSLILSVGGAGFVPPIRL
jgi:hypothetical protein